MKDKRRRLNPKPQSTFVTLQPLENMVDVKNQLAFAILALKAPKSMNVIVMP
ncbi:MAG: hypothetical protein SXG53_04805 [Pseudomonadota bacterium]|nr:hypothetical protein [Pseudomonadota bacterium]